MSLTSPMDGIPYLIWRDFPHPHGPNEHGRGLIPFTDFEITLARQILSCSLYKQQYVQPLVNSALRPPNSATCASAPCKQRERVVRELPKRARESALQEETVVGDAEENMYWAVDMLGLHEAPLVAKGATTFLEALKEGDESSEHLTESDIYNLENPSLFSHRSTVQDLIDSFHRNAIGPLAGTNVCDENDFIAIVEMSSLDTLDCALGKWQTEQEEHELEMRWRATKRVSENWLTQVGPVRERKEHEREHKKAGPGAMGKLVVGDGNMQQQGQGNISWPQSHPLAQPPRLHGAVENGVSTTSLHPPPASQNQFLSMSSINASGLQSTIVTAPESCESEPPPPIAMAHLTTTTPSSTATLPTPSASAVSPTITASSSAAIAPSSTNTTPSHIKISPPISDTSLLTTDNSTSTDNIATLMPATIPAHSLASTATLSTPTLAPVSASCIQPAPETKTHPPTLSHSPARPYPHAPYDPRHPYFQELPLEDLIHVPPESPGIQQLTFPGGPRECDSPRTAGFSKAAQCYQQHSPAFQRPPPPAPHQCTQCVLHGHDSVGRLPERPCAPATTSHQHGLGMPPVQTGVQYAACRSLLSNHQSSVPSNNPLSFDLSNSNPAETSDHRLIPGGEFSPVSRSEMYSRQLNHTTSVRAADSQISSPQSEIAPRAPCPNGCAASSSSSRSFRSSPCSRAHPHLPILATSLPSPRSHAVSSLHPHFGVTQRERASAHDKIMRHVTLLVQAPRITAGQVIVRNPAMTHASNLAPLFLALFPEYAGRDPSVLISGIRSGQHPISPSGPVTKACVSNPSSPPTRMSAVPEPLREASLLTTMPDEVKPSASRPTPVVTTCPFSPPLEDTPMQGADSTSNPVSPFGATPDASAEPATSNRTDNILRPFLECAPVGKRLIRVADNFTGDIFKATYWFEPDVEAANRFNNILSLMERFAGWKRPERKTRIVNGEWKAKGPDDLVA